MSRLRTLSLALSGFSLAAGLLVLGRTANAQIDQTGWLEGTVTDTEGRVLNNPAFSGAGGAYVRGVRQGGGEFSIICDQKLGGLYSARNLKPGIYEVTVTNAVRQGIKHHPQRVFGVLVRPDVRTVINFKISPGETVEEIGEPAVATDSIPVLADKLTVLQRQIDDLKRRLP